MQIARDSGRIAKTYSADTNCPWCKKSKLRYDLEFQIMSFENGHTLETNEIIQNLCAHCLTVCDELPRMDFLCAKCGQLTVYSGGSPDSECALFSKVFSGDDKFERFHKQLINDGLAAGKRFCLHCMDRLWRDYLANPDSVQKELEKPKPYFALNP
jgi:hypothetical protein